MSMQTMSTEQDKITPSEWEWVKSLIEDLRIEEKAEGIRNFIKEVLQWENLTDFVRKAELQRMVLATPSETEMEIHAICLNGLIMVGRTLLLRARGIRSELEQFGVTLEEMQANIEDLERSLREWHLHGLTEAELTSLQTKIYGEAQVH